MTRKRKTAQANVTLHMIFLTDNVKSENLAKQIYEKLRARLPEGAETTLSVWRFDSVTIRRTPTTADDIKEADSWA